MRVRKLMTKEVGVCRSDENVAKVVKIMCSRDCGAVPIVNGDGKPIGMITDRDITLAVSRLGKKVNEILVSEIIKGKVTTCDTGDKLEIALRKMKRKQLNRLPVVDKDGKISGILSITDFLVSTKIDKALRKKVYSTMKAIAKPNKIILKEIAA